MLGLLVVLSSLFVLGTRAGASSLPFSDVNILVVTDVHSFVGGHPHEADKSADYGQVVSFYEHLKLWSDENDHDLWFVMNGDWLHGTGLAMDGNATHLVPILNRMPWDALTLGNHEAYHNSIVEIMRDSMIPNFQGKFVTSNVLMTETMEPLGVPYQILHGKKTKLLVFGFLYNLQTPCEMLTVKKVEDTVQEHWFQEVLVSEGYDALMVLAHMDAEDPLLKTILTAIRQHVAENMPVQFITGHTHVRAKAKVDHWSYSVEAGANLDTVGFVSFPIHTHAQSVSRKDARNLFQHQFIDARASTLSGLVGNPEPFQTENGTALSKFILDTQNRLDLHETIACPDRNYFRNVSIYADNSIWKLWRERVIPTQLFKKKKQENSIMIVSSNSWRYDFMGSGEKHTMSMDDVVSIAPFMEPVVYVGQVPHWTVKRLNSSLNTDSRYHKHLVPDYVMVGDPSREERTMLDLYTHEYNLQEVMVDLARYNQVNLKPRRTGDRDTLLWLNFVEQAFPCKGHPIHDDLPWFHDPHALDEERTDGRRSGASADDSEFDGDKAIPTPAPVKHSVPTRVGSGYQGYIPPSTVAKYDMPPEAVPTGVTVVVQPTAPAKKPKKKPSPAEIQAKKDRKVKRRKKAMKIGGVVIGVLLLLFPLVGLFQSVTGRDNDDMDDEIFYDQEEIRSLKKKNKKKQQQQQQQQQRQARHEQDQKQPPGNKIRNFARSVNGGRKSNKNNDRKQQHRNNSRFKKKHGAPEFQRVPQVEFT